MTGDKYIPTRPTYTPEQIDEAVDNFIFGLKKLVHHATVDLEDDKGDEIIADLTKRIAVAIKVKVNTKGKARREHQEWVGLSDELTTSK